MPLSRVRQLARSRYDGSIGASEYRQERRKAIDDVAREAQFGPATVQPISSGRFGEDFHADVHATSETSDTPAITSLSNALLERQPQADDISLALSGAGEREASTSSTVTAGIELETAASQAQQDSVDVDLTSKSALDSDHGGSTALPRPRHTFRLLILVVMLGCAFVIYRYDRDLAALLAYSEEAKQWAASVKEAYLR